VAEQGFGSYFNRLRDMFGTALNTAGQVSSNYNNTGNRLAGLAIDRGNSQAGYDIQQGQIVPGIIGDAIKIAASLAGTAMGKPPGTYSGSSIYGIS
jgi:hypothetical protein